MQQVEGVSILWAAGWHDGPTEGVAQQGDQHFWFSAMWDESVDEYTNKPRVLMLYELTEEEFLQEAEVHRRFEELVGNTTFCYHLPPNQRHGPTGSPGDEARFYEEEQARTERPYSSRAPVGRFLVG